MSKTHHISLLFRDISNGSKNAFDTLFRMYYANLLGFAKNYVSQTEQAEEVVSDVFVWLWNNRPTLNEIDNPEVYLFTAVKNRCLNTLRSNKKTVLIDECHEIENDADENPLTQMEQKELTDKLHAIIENLPEQQRIVFRMIKENGLTAKQTAEILQLSSRTVETHIYKAIRQLEKEITEYLGYSPKKKVMRKMIMLVL